MSTNLLALAESAIGNDFSRLAGQFLGESTDATQGAVSSLLPAVLAGIAQKGATTEGASDLMSLVNRSNLDTGALGNIAGMFGNGNAGLNGLMKSGANSLVPALFGDKSGALVSALASSSRLKSSSASNLVAMMVPIVLMVLKKLVGDRALSAGSLSSLLTAQGPHLQRGLDSRLTGALGIPNAVDLVGGLGSAATDSARRAGGAVVDSATALGGAGMAAGGAVAAAGGSLLQRAWPWLLGIAILALLWGMLSPKATAPVPKALVTAPATTGVGVFPVKVYFDTGSATVGSDSTKAITAGADAIKKDGIKVAITGYTDKAGDTTTNETLARNRALAVRDALTAAGVPLANIDMRSPMFVEIGSTTNDAEARRVEIASQ